jgi:hypothetical protein
MRRYDQTVEWNLRWLNLLVTSDFFSTFCVVVTFTFTPNVTQNFLLVSKHLSNSGIRRRNRIKSSHTLAQDVALDQKHTAVWCCIPHCSTDSFASTAAASHSPPIPLHCTSNGPQAHTFVLTTALRRQAIASTVRTDTQIRRQRVCDYKPNISFQIILCTFNTAYFWRGPYFTLTASVPTVTANFFSTSVTDNTFLGWKCKIYCFYCGARKRKPFAEPSVEQDTHDGPRTKHSCPKSMPTSPEDWSYA